MSVYAGVAEAASDLTLGLARKKSERGLDPNLPYLLGEMGNTLVTAQLAVRSMTDFCDDYAFEPTIHNRQRRADPQDRRRQRLHPDR